MKHRPRSPEAVSDAKERAATLRGEGLTYEQIATELGISVSTVCRWLSPDGAETSRRESRDWKERNAEANLARNREYSRRPENRGRCQRCKGLMAVRTDGVCRACVSLLCRENYSRIQRMWAEGFLMAEICEELGMTKGTLGKSMDRMRKEGWDLPYRYARKVKATC